MNRLRTLSTAFLALILLLAGCSDAPEEADSAPEVSAPPSVRAEAAPPVRQIHLSDAQVEELHVETVTVGRDSSSYAMALPGQVHPAPDHYAQVSAPISGRVAAMYAHEGETVRRGEPLLALESLEFANLAAEYLQANAEVVYMQQQVERLETLVERKITPRARLERSEADLSRASASASATYARLMTLGVTDQQMASWSAEARERPVLVVYAPLSGVVDKHLIDQGQSVEAYQQMMSVLDPQAVLIRGFLSPEDAEGVQVGDPVTVRLRERAGRELRAAVTTINPSVDAENRAVSVNIITPTQARWPMPGQQVQIEIEASGGSAPMMLPLSAVQYEGDQAAVFVAVDDRTFEKRPITIERVNDESVTVTDGLREGERVAVSQVFSLKALERFEQYAD